MSNATLPHAVALAQELETELRHLDALQRHYTQLLVHQLSSLDFLDGSDSATTVAAGEPTMVHNGGYVAAKPEAVTTPCITQPLAATSEPPPPPPPPKRRGRSTAKPATPRRKADTTRSALPRQQPHVAAAPPVPSSLNDKAAQRARWALRLLREERDAYFNAKARRAEELLREGREAAQKSRARRQAEAIQSLPKSG
ncbi:hypothetical protein, unknown function [Leishmania braziliensis MHOM/BR/75/M2904]|uniref:Uncharacterized protein n=1 Tax=Leishmania braziliensis TaxID=5660 RepID=A4H493_LEIBR|nr:hypothetical protein, unknown function [Leishmania braziliensis MHOM/BR/75/M2904]KAI5685321.1 hypothetical protein MNV84_00562 [Leishmania braziliensis]CAJ2466351.1 unnamed protein product [Leishmania braziliensis]CAJ2466961.1 unnamed protein product [Leishmania braziliensis]CAM36882.1 hypothetical protein, unknown function [Leishmania braziliensis MHOM/BR/75/M2904]